MAQTRPPQKHDGHLGGVRGAQRMQVMLLKRGHPNRLVEVTYLAPRFELMVDRLCVSESITWWRDLPTFDRGLFIETYELMSNNPPWAEFRSLRRAHELARQFDPARLPA